jgi:amino acid transporter
VNLIWGSRVFERCNKQCNGSEKMGFFKTIAELIGIVLIIAGIILFALGLYGLAGGTAVTFTVNERTVTPQEGGQILTIAGIVALFVGVILAYVGFKRMK